MHLFALLITASFASQFVAPNLYTGIATVAPATVSFFEAMTTLPAITVTMADDSPAGTPANLAFEYVGSPAGTEVKISVTPGTPTGTTVFPLPATDISTLIPADPTGFNTFNLVVTDSTVPDSNAGPFTEPIPVDAAETFTPAIEALEDGFNKFPEVAVSCTDTRGWVDGMKVTYADSATPANKVTSTLKKKDNAGTITWSINPTVDLGTLGYTYDTVETKSVVVTLTRTVTRGGNPVEVNYPKTATVALTKVPRTKFTISPAKIDGALPATQAFTITARDGLAITADQGRALIKAAAAAAAAGDFTGAHTAAITGTGAAGSPYTTTITLTALPETTVNTEELYFWVLSATGTVQDKCQTIAWNQIPVGSYTVQSTPIEFDDLTDPDQTITITNLGTAEQTTWKAEVDVLFYTTSEATGVHATGTLVEESNAGEPVYEVELPALNTLGLTIAGGDIIVKVSPKDNGQYIALTDRIITVNPGLEFDFRPTTIKEDEMKADKIAVSAAPLTSTAWDALAKVEVTITNATTPPAGTAVWVELKKPVAPTSNDADTPLAFQGEVDLKSFDISTIAANKLYAHIQTTAADPPATSNASPVLLTVPHEITFVPAAAFTVAPATVVESEFDDWKSFTVTKKGTPAWGSTITVVLSPHAPDAQTRPKDVVKASQAVTSGACKVDLDEADFTKLDTTLEKDLDLYVYVGTDTATALAATPATISFEEDPVVPIIFTIDPTSMKWAEEELKTPAITVKPPTGHGWPEVEATGLKLQFSYGDKPAISTDIKYASSKYTVAATDIISFAIVKDDLPATVKVNVYQGDKAIGTPVDFKVNGAMGVAPLFSLLAAVLFCLVKLF